MVLWIFVAFINVTHVSKFGSEIRGIRYISMEEFDIYRRKKSTQHQKFGKKFRRRFGINVSKSQKSTFSLNWFDTIILEISMGHGMGSSNGLIYIGRSNVAVSPKNNKNFVDKPPHWLLSKIRSSSMANFTPHRMSVGDAWTSSVSSVSNNCSLSSGS